MELVVAGWGRNHGERTIIHGDIATAPLRRGGGLEWSEVSLEVIPSRGKFIEASMKFSASAELKGLNGSYLVELRLRKSEIARLFTNCFQGDVLASVIETLKHAAEWDEPQEK